MANVQDAVFDYSMEAEVHRQLHGDWQFVGTAPALAY
jgi:hypothetical protein